MNEPTPKQMISVLRKHYGDALAHAITAFNKDKRVVDFVNARQEPENKPAEKPVIEARKAFCYVSLLAIAFPKPLNPEMNDHERLKRATEANQKVLAAPESKTQQALDAAIEHGNKLKQGAYQHRYLQ